MTASPSWNATASGSASCRSSRTCKDGSRLLRLYAHPAIVPALALMTFVLGLNLLADALREESLKD